MTNREKANEWWSNLSLDEKLKKKNEYFCEDTLLADLDEIDIENMYVYYHLVV
jgi:hypothetical protein